MAQQRFELREADVPRLQPRRRHREKLGPVRPGSKGLQLRLDQRKDLSSLQAIPASR